MNAHVDHLLLHRGRTQLLQLRQPLPEPAENPSLSYSQPGQPYSFNFKHNVSTRARLTRREIVALAELCRMNGWDVDARALEVAEVTRWGRL